DVLDPALLRPGRFDRQVVMELPDIKERQAILAIHSREVPLAPEVNMRMIAERTPGFSGADIANLINEAAILGSRQNQDTVTQANLEDSIEKVLLGPEKRSRVLSQREKEVTAYHEAGHAVVAYYMPHTDPVRKISIIARGHAGGYTLKLPEEDKRLHTRTEFLGELATLLGGYIAEITRFDELTTGASNDLQKASSLARRIVTDFGMSELGPVTFGHKEEYVFLGKELHEARNYSEATAAKIDEEIARLIAAARQQAQRILTEHRDKLELIAKTLMEKETIDQVGFARLMRGQHEALIPDPPAGPPAGNEIPVGPVKPAPGFTPDVSPSPAFTENSPPGTQPQ